MLIESGHLSDVLNMYKDLADKKGLGIWHTSPDQIL